MILCSSQNRKTFVLPAVKFMKDLMGKLSHELESRVRLDCLRFLIQYLHAYLDDLPAGLVRNL